MIGQTISHYKITAKLGAGGMGEVYLATDMSLDRQVALKFLPESLQQDPEARERLIREAKAASRLHHPNILTIHAVEHADGRDFIVMEYVEGKPLTESSRDLHPTIPQILDLAIAVADGLQKAHASGVIHRDLKPANILIDSDGVPRLVDFGLAKMRGTDKLTKTGSTLGTVAYMSPEQAMGKDVDLRSDIFSFGAVLYELITGRTPFPGAHEAAITYAIINEAFEPMSRYKSGVPSELERVVAKSLAKSPAERYQSVADMVADLRHLKRDSSPGVSAPSVRRRKMLAVLPFENLGPADDEYFADGITEEITSRLGAAGGLGVISRTSSMQYKGTRKSMREIGADLGVDFILEGTVRWSRSPEGSSRVRITPQLIRVDEDTHVWSERYDRVIDDIFAVQSEIAEQVFSRLNVALGEPERRGLQTQPTDNLDAYYAYLRGLDYARRLDNSHEDLRLAAQMLERALELDGSFAQAHAELSLTQSAIYFFGYDQTAPRLTRAKESAERALALKPDLPEGHIALGYYYYRGRIDWDLAVEEFQIAARCCSNQSEPLANISWIRRRQGRFAEALDLGKQALRLDPRSAQQATEAGITCLVMRRYPEAEELLNRSMALAPDQTYAFGWKAYLYLTWMGDVAKARATLEQIISTNPHETFFHWFQQLLCERNYEAALKRVSVLGGEHYEHQVWFWTQPQLEGVVLQLMGRHDEARARYEVAAADLEHIRDERPDDHRVRLSLAQVYAGLGKRGEAAQEAGVAVALMPVVKDAIFGPILLHGQASVTASIGDYETALRQVEYLLSIPSWLSPALLRIEPYWDPLRDHPQFQKLLEQPDKVF